MIRIKNKDLIQVQFKDSRNLRPPEHTCRLTEGKQMQAKQVWGWSRVVLHVIKSTSALTLFDKSMKNTGDVPPASQAGPIRAERLPDPTVGSNQSREILLWKQREIWYWTSSETVLWFISEYLSCNRVFSEYFLSVSECCLPLSCLAAVLRPLVYIL